MAAAVGTGPYKANWNHSMCGRVLPRTGATGSAAGEADLTFLASPHPRHPRHQDPREGPEEVSRILLRHAGHDIRACCCVPRCWIPVPSHTFRQPALPLPRRSLAQLRTRSPPISPPAPAANVPRPPLRPARRAPSSHPPLTVGRPSHPPLRPRPPRTPQVDRLDFPQWKFSVYFLQSLPTGALRGLRNRPFPPTSLASVAPSLASHRRPIPSALPTPKFRPPPGSKYPHEPGSDAAHAYLWSQPGVMLELTHNYGTENQARGVVLCYPYATHSPPTCDPHATQLHPTARLQVPPGQRGARRVRAPGDGGPRRVQGVGGARGEGGGVQEEAGRRRGGGGWGWRGRRRVS